MNIITAFLLSFTILLLNIPTKAQHEIAEGKWIQLFNGKDLKDWDIKITKHEAGDNYGNTFRVEDGLLKVRYDQYSDFDGQFGHIFYNKPYSAYLLVVQYRFTGQQVKGGPDWAVRNNGIMLHSQSANSMLKNQDFPVSIETQLLGGMGSGERTTANVCTPGTHIMMNNQLVTEHCISSSSKTYHGDQWVEVEMLVLRDSVVYNIVQGDTVFTYTKPQIGGEFVTNVDSAVKQDGQLLKKGYIALQAESAPIDFRKIAIFDLEPYMDDPKALKKILGKLRKRRH